MAKVTLPHLASYNKDGIRLVKGVNEDVPTHIAAALMGDNRFVVQFAKNEDVNAALSQEPEVDTNGQPKDKTQRLAVIAGAILYVSLNDEMFPNAITSSGAVDARTLTKLLGWQVTSVDRDEAQKRMEKGSLEPIEYIDPGQTETKTEEDPVPSGQEDATEGTEEKPSSDTPNEQTPPQSAEKPKGKIKISSGKSKGDGTGKAVKV